MVQLKTEPSSPKPNGQRLGKKVSAGAANLLGSLKSVGKDFSALLARTEKAGNAKPAPAAERVFPAEGREKAAQAEKAGAKKPEARPEKTADKEQHKDRKKTLPGAEAGSNPETAAIFREMKAFLAEKAAETDGKTGGIGAFAAQAAGRGKPGDPRLPGSAEKPLSGKVFGAAEQRTAESAVARKDDSKKPKAEEGKAEKSSHEIRKEKAKERQREAAQERPAAERTEVKDSPSPVLEDQKKDVPRETFEIRVTGKNGTFEKIAEDLRNSQDGRETRELSSQILKQLREDGNASVVRSARIILKDREEGEIRLILKPEKLGEVRIRLHLQDHLIGGQIHVENSTVREAFEQNLKDLAAAFRESGFELGNLDVTVGDGREGRSEGETPKFTNGREAAEFERSVPRVEALKFYASNSVNIMV